jgi:hypothetical protein
VGSRVAWCQRDWCLSRLGSGSPLEFEFTCIVVVSGRALCWPPARDPQVSGAAADNELTLEDSVQVDPVIDC